jgi:trk system potassium uptake protein TrkH
MHLKVVFKTVALLVLIVDAFLLACALVGAYYEEWAAVKGLILTVALSASLSGIIFMACRSDKKRTLAVRDSFIFVTLSWIAVSMTGALPYVFGGGLLGFTDAFFESMSGFSTTGATVISDIEIIPKSILLWRSLTQWLGGMGIVVLTVAILPMLGVGGMQLIQAELTGPAVDKITPRITETAKYLWYIYIAFTIILTLLLVLGGMSFFDSLNHALSTVASGGFSTKNDSLGHFNSAYFDWVVTLFMFLAGVNFTLHFRFLTGKFKTALTNTEFKAYVGIVVTAASMAALGLYFEANETIANSFRHALFQCVSVITTTGFTTSDYGSWPHVSQVVLFVLMLTGACAGSTSGGVKLVRYVILLKQGLNELKHLIYPRGVFVLKISGSSVNRDIVYAVSGFFFLYAFTVMAVTLAVAASGVELLTSLSAALSTVGNIGTGFGGIGAGQNCAFFSDYVKWVLSFAMMAGRLELYTVFVLFTPIFWKR